MTTPNAHTAPAPPLTFRTIAVDGGVIPVALAGEGSMPVILLHGWTLDHRLWTPQLAEMGDTYRLIMPDRRGCGQATAPPDLLREAEDVIAIADALGFDRFALVGLSRGATVALDVACRFAARVSALVVSGAPLPTLVPREEVIDLDRFRAQAASGALASLRAEWAQHPLMATHSPDAAALAAAMLADYDGRDLIVATETPEFPSAVLAKLSMPVLALTGTHDTPWRKACAAALAAIAPRAMHALVPNAGHLANADNPDRFNALVSSFLRNSAEPTTRPQA
ncbi:MAG TPA: alpha/beta hydrolase [Erythrobacter sp.]|nr:alpha/beta hydrolase [Erythrobacter sp.]